MRGPDRSGEQTLYAAAPSPLRRHGGEKINGYVMGERKARQISPGLGGQETSWMAYVVRNVRVPCARAEYVKSKDPVNASRWSQD